MLTDRKDFLDRALADEHVRAVFPRQNDGKAPAHEVEWNFVDVLVLVLQVKVLADFDMLEDRDVKQVSSRIDNDCSDRQIPAPVRYRCRECRDAV